MQNKKMTGETPEERSDKRKPREERKEKITGETPEVRSDKRKPREESEAREERQEREDREEREERCPQDLIERITDESLKEISYICISRHKCSKLFIYWQKCSKSQKVALGTYI